MIFYGGGIITGDRAVQVMRCSNCGKYLGNHGWEGNKVFNDIEENGWKYCPYCGERLDVKE